MKCRRCPNKALPGWRGYCKKHYHSLLRSEGRQSGTVPVEAVRNHVLALHDAGMPWVRIQELAGLGNRTVDKIRSTSVKRVHLETAKKILAIESPAGCRDDVAPRARIPAIGTQRRLQALLTLGYSGAVIGRELGLTRWAIGSIVAGNRGDLVEVGTARGVARLFREWEMLPAPDGSQPRRIRTLAQRKRFVPPFAWDEDSIDDPDAEPQLPKDPDGAWFDDYRELRALGLTNDHIAERWGLQRESLRQRLRRLLPDDEYERYIA